jgi:pSer/pThr/pTyr-binding forkhead associated (FHA) protein
MPASLRTTLPAVGGSPALGLDGATAGARIENVNPRSIEAWGAKIAKSTSPPPEAKGAPSPSPLPAEAPRSAPGHRRLMMTIGGGNESLDLLSAQNITVGKHRDCDVVCRAFPSPENDSITHGVSRQHARLQVISGKLMIEDLRSLNGTFVDDRRLALGTQVALTDGQLVRLGPVLTMEVRIFRTGAALLRRVDEYHGNFPSTLLLWREASLGDPILGLTTAGSETATRWGSVRVHGDSGELWWYGPPSVQWQRAGRNINGAQALTPGDRLTIGALILDWDVGVKPGLV